MLNCTETEQYEVLYHIQNRKATLFSKNACGTSPSIMSGDWPEWKRDRLREELAYLSTLLRVGQESAPWVIEHEKTFWKAQLSCPAPQQLLLRVDYLQSSQEACALLAEKAESKGAFFCPKRIERILVRLELNGEYRITSIGEKLSKLLGVRNGGSITQLLGSTLYHQGNAFLNLCLDTDQTLHTTDIVYHQNNRHYLMITAAPISHEQRHIMLSIFFIEPEMFYQLRVGAIATDHGGTKEDQLGIAFFRNNTSKPVFCNPAFQRMLPKEHFTVLCMAAQLRLAQSSKSEIRFLYQLDSNCTYICTASTTDEGMFLILRWDPINSCSRLTQRELEIAGHLCTDAKLKTIANNCGIEEGTVKKMASNIYRKVSVAGRLSLIISYRR